METVVCSVLLTRLDAILSPSGRVFADCANDAKLEKSTRATLINLGRQNGNVVSPFQLVRSPFHEGRRFRDAQNIGQSQFHIAEYQNLQVETTHSKESAVRFCSSQ
eukprot:TRINITY_DN15477_c0_g1_i1.p2 TRINITY_DN15477_c0_g1~~TRINITY_DN15477_c0_g1_i1.p2  ORF type:complete len:106 (-),score=13.75 TRINITY_DN15477_c0_g1_i1:48-365(-)